MHPWLPEHFSSVPDDESLITVTTNSSNATDDGRVGAGRTVGLFYAYAGGKLERGLGKLAGKIKRSDHNPVPPPSADPSPALAGNRSYDSIITLSTTATADDLPGAGRTVGLLLTYLGRRVEKSIGKSAEHLGRGPRQLTIRIIKRSSELTRAANASRSALSPTEVQARYKRIAKGCSRLLKYAGSNVPGTRQQALEDITLLAISDPYLRGLFNVLGAVAIIEAVHTQLRISMTTWSDFEASLLSTSRKAIVSLSDVSVNSVSKELLVVFSAAGKLFLSSNSPILETLFTAFFSNLKDPERSFLVVRHLKHITESIRLGTGFHALSKNLYHLVDAMDDCPDNLEWQTIDPIICFLLSYLMNKTITAFNAWQSFKEYVFWKHLLERTLRFASKLPLTIGSTSFRWLVEFEQSEGSSERHALTMLLLIQGIHEANPHFLLTADYRDNYTRLKSMYTYDGLHILLRRLACPPEFILFQIVGSPSTRNAEITGHPLFHQAPLSALHPAELRRLCLLITAFVDHDDDFVRSRARINAKYLLSRDICCRNILKGVLSENKSGFSASSEYHSLLLYTSLLCAPREKLLHRKYKNTHVHRHCDASGAIVHIFKSSGECELSRLLGVQAGRNGKCLREDRISWCRDDVLCVRVPPGETFHFSTYGYHPILAGKDKKGADLYITWAPMVGPVSSSSPSTSGWFCSAPEGAERVYFRDKYGNEGSTDDFYIFVLRFDPKAYQRVPRYQINSPGGRDHTGPYGWDKVRDIPQKRSFEAFKKDPTRELLSILGVSR